MVITSSGFGGTASNPSVTNVTKGSNNQQWNLTIVYSGTSQSDQDIVINCKSGSAASVWDLAGNAAALSQSGTDNKIDMNEYTES